MLTKSVEDLLIDQSDLVNLQLDLVNRIDSATGDLKNVLRIFTEILKDRTECTKTVLAARKSKQTPILPAPSWQRSQQIPPMPISSQQPQEPPRPRLYVPDPEPYFPDFDPDDEVMGVSAPQLAMQASARAHPANYDSDEDLWDATGGVEENMHFEEDIPPPLPLPHLPVTYVNRDDEATKTPFYSEVQRTLKDVFGLQQFRPFQLEAINATLTGRDAFILFPTGGGKSLCFQLPAVCKWGKKGLTVVVSPLLSLIENQTNALLSKGVDVVTLGSSITQVREIAQRLKPGPSLPSLLYCTPEKLEHSGMLQSILATLDRAGQLLRFVIDEAHCISLWGMDFRSSYKNLVQLRERYPKVPIMALTATANPQTQDDVIKTLRISNCVRLTQPFNRPNLWYEVRKKNTNTVQQIAEFIRSKHSGHTGVIYCSSRDKCEIVAKQLRQAGLSAKHYHAEIPPEDKKQVQEEWQNDKCKIIVATIAFGMGIDKPDVRFVIHHGMPTSLDGYYQESGRAGRDGLPADCILFYAFRETTFLFKRIRENETATRDVKAHQEDGLRHMIAYCENDVDCRRVQVLNYFGQPITREECNAHCDNCADGVETHEQDVSGPAQSAVKLAIKLTVGISKPVSKTELVSKLYAQHKDSAGSGKTTPKAKLERLVNRLFAEGLLDTIAYQTGQNIHSKVQVGHRGIAFAKNGGELTMTFKKGAKKSAPSMGAPAGSVSNAPKRTATSAPVKIAKATYQLDDDAIEVSDEEEEWETKVAESDIGGDSDVEILDNLDLPTSTATTRTLEEENYESCFKELREIRRKHPQFAEFFQDDILQELSLMLPSDMCQFKDILKSADVKLQESDFKLESARVYVDCCIRYSVRHKKLLSPVEPESKAAPPAGSSSSKLISRVVPPVSNNASGSKPVSKAAPPVSVGDLHSRYSHQSKPSSSSGFKPARR
ncbi:hypothetical protein EUX98_g7827 [Antrodiella citrinella]|uniref:ATP-dependent DNA helicase n=1 Tax=Antrodiella citrinella TaxID=2447956 RepID=A0A4V3XHR9_9APHY|nr:hypothetical protein EUX98_g7827 [Antrodiella citrinella]